MVCPSGTPSYLCTLSPSRRWCGAAAAGRARALAMGVEDDAIDAADEAVDVKAALMEAILDGWVSARLGVTVSAVFEGQRQKGSTMVRVQRIGPLMHARVCRGVAM